MTALRQRMTEEMRIRNLSPNTIDAYLRQGSRFARHFKRSPAELGPEEVRDYQLHLTHRRMSSLQSTRLPAHCGLYIDTRLAKSGRSNRVLYAKKPKKLPLVLSQAGPSFHCCDRIASSSRHRDDYVRYWLRVRRR